MYQTIPPSSSGGIDPWPAQQKNFIASLGLGLTGYEHLHAGYYALGGALAALTPNDGTLEGGAEANPAATAQVFTASIVQTAKTTAFALTCRIKMPVPAAGKLNRFGLLTGAGTARITMGTDNAVGATNYYGQVEGTSTITTIAATTALANLTIAGNGTNIVFYVNGVSGVSIATSALTGNEALYFFISGTDVKTTIFTDLLVGYIRP